MLLRKLFIFGVSGYSSKWFEHYLNNGTQGCTIIYEKPSKSSVEFLNGPSLVHYLFRYILTVSQIVSRRLSLGRMLTILIPISLAASELNVLERNLNLWYRENSKYCQN